MDESPNSMHPGFQHHRSKSSNSTEHSSGCFPESSLRSLKFGTVVCRGSRDMAVVDNQTDRLTCNGRLGLLASDASTAELKYSALKPSHAARTSRCDVHGSIGNSDYASWHYSQGEQGSRASRTDDAPHSSVRACYVDENRVITGAKPDVSSSLPRNAEPANHSRYQTIGHFLVDECPAQHGIATFQIPSLVAMIAMHRMEQV